MIAENRYQCSGANLSDVTIACTEQGCSTFALTCGQKECSCRPLHKNHHLIYFDDIIDAITQPLKLPEHLLKLQQCVQAIINGFIGDMERLRTSHREHIRQSMEKLKSSSALRKKLLVKESLYGGGATGDHFFKLVQEASKPLEICNPYRIPNNEVEKVVETVRNEMDTIRVRIEELWARPSFRFSSAYKHPSIILSQDNTTAAGTNQLFCFVMVQPALSMQGQSHISFRIHKRKNILLGVCYRKQVEKYDYAFSIGFDMGAYMVRQSGVVYSHSIEEDSGQETTVKFEEGEVVCVEFKPGNGTVTYSNKEKGTSYCQKTSIDKATQQPIYFCARLCSPNEHLSIV